MTVHHKYILLSFKYRVYFVLQIGRLLKILDYQHGLWTKMVRCDWNNIVLANNRRQYSSDY